MPLVKRERGVLHASSRRHRVRRSRPLAERVTSRVPVKPQALGGRIKRDRTFNLSRGFQATNCPHSLLRRLESDPGSCIVSVDGACRNNGQLGAQAGYGVWFSHDRGDLNTKGLVPPSFPQTSQYAELYAAKIALHKCHELIIAGEDLTQVIIKTDSEYLANGLCRWVWKWSENGYRNVRGQPVVNGRMFKGLHEWVDILEREYNVTVSFCHVARRHNVHADTLAKAALD